MVDDILLPLAGKMPSHFQFPTKYVGRSPAAGLGVGDCARAVALDNKTSVTAAKIFTL
jgi:hypothetical protein